MFRVTLSLKCKKNCYIVFLTNILPKFTQNTDKYAVFEPVYTLLLLIMLAFALNAFAQPATTVAVLPSEGASLSNDELEALTDKMRGAALKVLPPETFILLKQDVVIKRLGGAENYIKECKESSCIVDLGKKAQVDYVAQASVGELGSKMRLKVELYNVSTGGLVGMFDGGGFFDDYFDLLDAVDKNVPDVFKKAPGASSGKVLLPAFAGGIGGLQTAGGGYEFAGEQTRLVSIVTEPEGAVLSFNGVPVSRCAKTPCKAELAEGSVRIIANLEQYEIADTTVSIKQNNQNINIRLKPNFGVLKIKPAYSNGIGKNERWSLAINGKMYHSLENRLNPGKYNVELSHECYEALSFEAGINKDKSEAFNMAGNIKLKMGGLVLKAEQDGEPVSEPVFVNGEQAGETPFSGTVPICADIDVGKIGEKANVVLKHNEKVTHTHKMPDSEVRLRRMEKERKKNQDKEAEKARKEEERAREEARRTAWMGEAILLLGAGGSLNMNDIDPNRFKSSGNQWNPINLEFYKRNLKFFRFGFNYDYGHVAIDKDGTRRMNNIPEDETITKDPSRHKLNAFIRLYPANFLFLSGGAGWEIYDSKYVDLSTPIFPVGGGIFLGTEDDKDVAGFVIEGLCNIVPFKGRTAKYISINVGIKIGGTLTKEHQNENKTR